MNKKLLIALYFIIISVPFLFTKIHARSLNTELLILPLECSLEIVDDGVQQTNNYSPDKCSQIIKSIEPEILPIENQSSVDEIPQFSSIKVSDRSPLLSHISEIFKSLFSQLSRLFERNNSLSIAGVLLMTLGLYAWLISQLL